MWSFAPAPRAPEKGFAPAPPAPETSSRRPPPRLRPRALAALAALASTGLAGAARADDDARVPPPPPPKVEPTPPPRGAKPGVIIPAPRPEEPPPRRIRFVAEPVSDGAILSLSVGIGALSGAILSTGEIVPQQPQSVDRLLAIDRGTVTAAPSKTWDRISDVGVYAAFGFAAVDSVLSGFRHGPDAAMADAFIYGETIAITWGVTNLAKIAFRRPRPSAYQEQQRLYDQYGEENAPAISDTNSALSFYSGHTAFAASVAATASYLAFARSPNTARPWVTLGVGAAVTALTAVGRVRGGEHFPTDVIAGAMAGAGIGVLVPHLHRADDAKQRPVWVGAAPSPGGGGAVSVGGRF